MKVAVIGAAGYAGGELLRILFEHPRVSDVQCLSQSQAGRPLSAVHDDFVFRAPKIFTDTLEPCDLVFLAGDHGQAQSLIDRHKVDAKAARVIDLSQDFRVGSKDYVYGLSEVYGERIEGCTRLANPGCFATAIQLALSPMAREGLLRKDIHVTAITGSTGAGQKLQRTSHFSQRSANTSAYKAFDHQHLTEIRSTLGDLQGQQELPPLHFIPLRGPFTRGILASVYTESDREEHGLLSLFQSFYARSAFVHVQSDEISLKTVINTNHVLIQLQKHGSMLHLVVCLDNLIKGASGQAIQNMNRMLGWPEDLGLHLKPVVY